MREATSYAAAAPNAARFFAVLFATLGRSATRGFFPGGIKGCPVGGGAAMTARITLGSDVASETVMSSSPCALTGAPFSLVAVERFCGVLIATALEKDFAFAIENPLCMDT